MILRRRRSRSVSGPAERYYTFRLLQRPQIVQREVAVFVLILQIQIRLLELSRYLVTLLGVS
jgi:hypothetical protein